MSITSSLDAATQQVLNLLAQLQLSNCRIVQCQDIGLVNAPIAEAVIPVTAYGSELIIIFDTAFVNTSGTCIIGMPGLGYIPLTTLRGGQIPIGALAGKVMIGFSSTATGYVGRLLSMDYSLFLTAADLPPPQVFPTIPTYDANGGVKDVGNVFSLDYIDLPIGGLTASDMVSFYSVEANGHYRIGVAAFAAVILSLQQQAAALNYATIVAQYAYAGSGDNVGNGTNVLVQYGNSINAFGSMNGGTLTINQRGVYIFTLVGTTSASAYQTNTYYGIYIQVNGTNVSVQSTLSSPGAGDNYDQAVTMSCAWVGLLNPGDVVSTYTYAGNGYGNSVVNVNGFNFDVSKIA